MAEKARRLAALHGAAYTYDTLEECLANSQVEAVYIATPPSAHLRQVEAVALAGRHVLCEKPLAMTATEAAEMVTTCARQSVLLMTAYRKCFEPSFVFIRDLILGGRIGALKILHASFSERHALPQTTPPWILDRRIAGGGPLMDLGIYCVHAARWLAGEVPSCVSAFQWTHDRSLFREIEEGIAFSMQFPSGLVAQASTCYSAALNSMLYLEGTRGSVSLTPAFPYEHERVLNARLGDELLHKTFRWSTNSGHRSTHFPEPFGVDPFRPRAGQMVMSTWQSSMRSTVPPRVVLPRQSSSKGGGN